MTWTELVSVGTDPLTGKRIVKRISAATEAECARLVALFKEEVAAKQRRGERIRYDQQPLGSYIEGWLDDLTHTPNERGVVARPSTQLSYRVAIHRLLHDESPSGQRLARTPLADLTPAQIQGRVRELIGEGYSPSTIRLAISALSRALEDAVRLDRIPVNPCQRVTKPSRVRPPLTIWTPDQARTFLAFVTDPTAVAQVTLGKRPRSAERTKSIMRRPSRNMALWASFFAIKLLTLTRKGELAAVQWQDVDLSSRQPTVRIGRTVARLDGTRFGFGPPKSESGYRVIPLLPQAVDAFGAIRDWQRSTIGERELVFDRGDGSPIYRESHHYLAALTAAANVPDIRVHDLRHAGATMLAASGVNPAIIARMIGHSTVTMTLDTYVHPSADDLRSAVDRLGSILFTPDDDVTTM